MSEAPEQEAEGWVWCWNEQSLVYKVVESVLEWSFAGMLPEVESRLMELIVEWLLWDVGVGSVTFGGVVGGMAVVGVGSVTFGGVVGSDTGGGGWWWCVIIFLCGYHDYSIPLEVLPYLIIVIFPLNFSLWLG